MNKLKLPLSLNIQYFAEDPLPGEQTPPDNKPPQSVPYERLSQEVAKRKAADDELAKLREKVAADEQAALTEQGKYKELYEAEQAKAQEATATAEAVRLNALKTVKLVEAGYTGETLEKAAKFVTGATDEEIIASVTDFAALVPAAPAQPADPTLLNGKGSTPPPPPSGDDAAYELGREAAEKFIKK